MLRNKFWFRGRGPRSEEAKREINPEQGELPDRLLLFTGKDDGKSRIQKAAQAFDALKEGNPEEADAKLTKLTGILRDAYQNDLRLMCAGVLSFDKKGQLWADFQRQVQFAIATHFVDLQNFTQLTLLPSRVFL